MTFSSPPGEVVQDSLPPPALRLEIEVGFGVERLLNECPAIGRLKRYRHLAFIIHAKLNEPVRLHAGVDAAKVDTGATVSRLHPHEEAATLAEVDLAARGVPVCAAFH